MGLIEKYIVLRIFFVPNKSTGCPLAILYGHFTIVVCLSFNCPFTVRFPLFHRPNLADPAHLPQISATFDTPNATPKPPSVATCSSLCCAIHQSPTPATQAPRVMRSARSPASETVFRDGFIGLKTVFSEMLILVLMVVNWFLIGFNRFMS